MEVGGLPQWNGDTGSPIIYPPNTYSVNEARLNASSGAEHSKRMKPIQWTSGKLRLLDQTLLPRKKVWLDIDNHQGVARAIKEMRVRGAPAIGVAAAYGVALAAEGIQAEGMGDFLARLGIACDVIAASRPTAVNLKWAVERMRRVAGGHDEVDSAKEALLAEAKAIHEEDEAINRRIGANGAELIRSGAVMTHCNAGALATAGYGTALGVIRSAVESGRAVRVLATETRPFLQGARLTAWELSQDGIDVTLITDSMAGHFLKTEDIGCVVVGADRIAANGDVANKIGTYSIAVLAKENSVPFYVAAPISTLDLSLESGDDIPIEERDPREVLEYAGVGVAPEGVKAAHPAFDVTPSRYVSAIITENGIARAPYGESLKLLSGNGV